MAKAATSRWAWSISLVVGNQYGEQHSQCVESAFAHNPGIKVVTPATPYDIKGLLISAIRDPRLYEMAPNTLRSPARRLGMQPVSIPAAKVLEEELMPWRNKIKNAVLDML